MLFQKLIIKSTRKRREIKKWSERFLRPFFMLAHHSQNTRQYNPELVNGLLSQLPQILNAALEIVNSLRSGILSMLPPDTIQATITLVTGLITELIQNLPMIVQAAIQLISGLLNSLYTSLPHRLLPVLST